MAGDLAAGRLVEKYSQETSCYCTDLLQVVGTISAHAFEGLLLTELLWKLSGKQ